MIAPPLACRIPNRARRFARLRARPLCFYGLAGCPSAVACVGLRHDCALNAICIKFIACPDSSRAGRRCSFSKKNNARFICKGAHTGRHRAADVRTTPQGRIAASPACVDNLHICSAASQTPNPPRAVARARGGSVQFPSPLLGIVSTKQFPLSPREMRSPASKYVVSSTPRALHDAPRACFSTLSAPSPQTLIWQRLRAMALAVMAESGGGTHAMPGCARAITGQER